MGKFCRSHLRITPTALQRGRLEDKEREGAPRDEGQVLRPQGQPPRPRLGVQARWRMIVAGYFLLPILTNFEPSTQRSRSRPQLNDLTSFNLKLSHCVYFSLTTFDEMQ